MGSFGPEKILLLILVLVLLFGAKRLPELGASLGKGIREFKGSLSGKDEAHPAEMPRASAREAARPVADDEGPEPRRLLP
jgi:sec-independent protein translocase protein TatA